MAIYIKMTKTKENNLVHYYNVETSEFQYSKPLIIGIDAKEKQLFFFINNDLHTPVYILDFHNLPENFKNKYIDDGLVYRIFKVARKAIMNNEYTTSLVYAA